MNEKNPTWIETVKQGGIVAGIILCGLGAGGCAGLPGQDARSQATEPDPIFTITLFCEPEDAELVPLVADDTTQVAAAGTHGPPPVLSGSALASVDSPLAAIPIEAGGSEYECFTLLEAMQMGAQSLTSQARYERSSTR